MITGLLTFSKFLSYLLSRYFNLTIALLAGFVIGSLNKVWPWKATISMRVNSHGESVPFLQQNMLPWNYNEVTGYDPQLAYSCLMILFGIVVVLVLENIGKKAK